VTDPADGAADPRGGAVPGTSVSGAVPASGASGWSGGSDGAAGSGYDRAVAAVRGGADTDAVALTLSLPA
jgi:hypothetical protein